MQIPMELVVSFPAASTLLIPAFDSAPVLWLTGIAYQGASGSAEKAEPTCQLSVQT